MISQAYTEIKERIKENTNLVDFIERDGVELRKSGQWYVGFCPFHENTRTPSFFCNDHYWECRGGCSDKGDIYAYVMKRDGCDFRGAMETIANGVTVNKPIARPKAPILSETKPKRIFSPIATKSENIAQWQAYAPTLTGELIRGHGLIVGKLPHSSCDHDRLLVPLTVNGVTLAIRGRSLGCDHVKWLQGAGGAHVIFNGAVILNKFVGSEHHALIPPTKERLLLGDTIFTAHGAIHTLVIVENLVDCILLQATIPNGHGVVAMGGINPNGAIWANLSTACKVAGVKVVKVAYDRPNERNEKETEGAWLNACKGLKDSGAEVIRYHWGGGQWKDFGEYFKAIAPCDHKLNYHFIGDDIYCSKCHLHFPQWDREQQIDLIRENSPYWVKNGH